MAGLSSSQVNLFRQRWWKDSEFYNIHAEIINSCRKSGISRKWWKSIWSVLGSTWLTETSWSRIPSDLRPSLASFSPSWRPAWLQATAIPGKMKDNKCSSLSFSLTANRLLPNFRMTAPVWLLFCFTFLVLLGLWSTGPVELLFTSRCWFIFQLFRGRQSPWQQRQHWSSTKKILLK